MRSAVMNDRAMISFIIKAFLELSTDNIGQMAYAKCVDDVMEDILDQKKFIVRLCKAKTELELVSLFNGTSFTDVYAMLSDDFQFTALRQTIAMSREIQALKIKIKKKIKKGSKPKKDRERLNKLEKMYKKSIKSFKTVLEIKDVKKDAKPKDKYSAVAKFNKIYSGDDGFYSYLLDDDFDYDFDEDYDFSPEQMTMLGMDSRPARYRRPTKQNLNISFDDEDDDVDLDDEDYEDDIDDLRDEMNDRFDKMDDKFNKIMSGIGKMISVHEGTADQQQTYNEEVISVLNDSDDSDIEERLGRIERILSSLVEVSDEEEAGRPRPVPFPDYEPSAEDQADVQQAMAAMFAGDDEPIKVKGEVVPSPIDPAQMSTPEVIDARNSAKGNSVDDMVQDTINGNQA